MASRSASAAAARPTVQAKGSPLAVQHRLGPLRRFCLGQEGTAAAVRQQGAKGLRVCLLRLGVLAQHLDAALNHRAETRVLAVGDQTARERVLPVGERDGCFNGHGCVARCYLVAVCGVSAAGATRSVSCCSTDAVLRDRRTMSRNQTPYLSGDAEPAAVDCSVLQCKLLTGAIPFAAQLRPKMMMAAFDNPA